MLSIGIFAFTLLVLKSRYMDFITFKFIKFSILGFFVPYLGYAINIFISALKIDENIFSTQYFRLFSSQSIFIIVLGLLIAKMILEYYGKEYSRDIPLGVLLGYSICIVLQLFFSNSVYLFWPLIDRDLILNFELISLKINAFLSVLIFIGLEFLFFTFSGKLILELILLGKINRVLFLNVNRWIKLQKFLFFLSLPVGFLSIFKFYLNMNVFIYLYILFYILSVVQFLIIILSIKFEKNARLN